MLNEKKCRRKQETTNQSKDARSDKEQINPPAKKDRGVKNEKYITFYSVKSDKNMRRLQIIIDQQY